MDIAFEAKLLISVIVYLASYAHLLEYQFVVYYRQQKRMT